MESAGKGPLRRQAPFHRLLAPLSCQQVADCVLGDPSIAFTLPALHQQESRTDFWKVVAFEPCAHPCRVGCRCLNH